MGSCNTHAADKPAASSPRRWVCHVINADPLDHGPDGVTIRDFNGDKLPDLLVPFEQGKYTRLYFHPGYNHARDRSKWKYITFPHGGEDAGAGDLDMDGHVDAIINGGYVYFNPGPVKAGDLSTWKLMTLFKKEARVPIVLDLDGDRQNDLLVRGATLYKAPAKDKRTASNWKMIQLGSTRWPMNAIPHDVDKDGDIDLYFFIAHRFWQIIHFSWLCFVVPTLPLCVA